MGGLAELFLYSFMCCILKTSIAQDIISPGQSLRLGETLVSNDGSFELGFFSPQNSERWYLGIWYKKISSKTIVWVANREFPLSNRSCALNITSQGTLIVVNGTNKIVWSSDTSRTAVDPVAQLMNSGNLVVRERKDINNYDNYLWQSFYDPSDTLLPGMKIGHNFVTGVDTVLSSWKSADDPAQGNFSLYIDYSSYPQLFIRKGDMIQFRAGQWDGVRFTGNTMLKPNPVLKFGLVFNEVEVYFRFELQNNLVTPRFTLNPSGLLQRLDWIDSLQAWSLYSTAMGDRCDTYAACGAYGSCEIDNSPLCSCLAGYVPKSPADWNLSNWSGGCVRRTALDCRGKDGFLKHSGIKLPDMSSSWYDKSISMSLEECEAQCLKNCSCTAYTTLDVRNGGSGCIIWFRDLLDIRKLTEGGQDLYVRMSASELGTRQVNNTNDQTSKNSGKKMIIGITIGLAAVLMLLFGLILYVRNKRHKKQAISGLTKSKDETEDMELPIFDLASIVKATNNFSNINKLGQGGFGPVYKGILTDGQEIAVKRLSKSSSQGLNEFRNEVIMIAKLQHRNLVKLLGCSIQGDEKMLIYEFMPNKSLDYFIFDKTRNKLLDWHKRVFIINGIARGLVYLHQDSRLRVIHRDLKASNILLDKDMNPKISDFGMARMFGADETEANTNKVVGTYGYMSPEYAVDGLFSIKSDVFSFGVLVLEVVTGKKNRGFSHPDHSHNLLGHAWKLWMEERSVELLDHMLDDSTYAASEALRCIQVGLLCVQQRPEDRPNMSSVVLMLGSECSLSQPKQPGFFTERNMPETTDSSSSKHKTLSVNEVTVSLLNPR